MSEGFGNTNVMYPAGVYPPPVQAWSGWPVEWNTPNWGEAVGGLGGIIGRVSVVFGAIDVNSSILSTMPPYRLQGSTVVGPTQWMINPQPEVYTGWTEAMELLVSYWARARSSCGPRRATATAPSATGSCSTRRGSTSR